MLILTAAALFAKNFFRPLFAPALGEAAVARLAKVMVAVIIGIALFFAIHGSQTLVDLLLLGYDGVTQFFPGVILGLNWKRVTRTAVWSGMLAGVGVLALLVLAGRDPFVGLNDGFIALSLNFFVVVAVSLLTPAEPSGFADVAGADLTGSRTSQAGRARTRASEPVHASSRRSVQRSAQTAFFSDEQRHA